MFLLDDVSDTNEFIQDPYRFYERLREAEAVQWSAKWNCWLVSTFADVQACLTNHQCFSNLGRVTGVIEQTLPREQLEQLGPLRHNYSRGLLNVDPPDHTRMKVLLLKAFRCRVNDSLAQRIGEFAEELLDEAEDRGQIELVGDFTFPLPVTIIADILGVPREDARRFKDWSTRIVAFQGTPNQDFAVMLKSQDALQEMRGYLSAAIEQRRRQPREDLLTALVQAQEEGDRLSQEEMLSSCVSILIGGHETTTKLMVNTIWNLLRHPEQMALLREDPSRMAVATEEFLRHCGPFHRIRRVLKEDMQLGGKEIPKGDSVMLLLACANRDPKKFEDPDTLNILRWPNKHVAFGYGPHLCLGAPLARLEMEIAIPAILQRWPDLAFASEDWQWYNDSLRGLKTLPLRF